MIVLYALVLAFLRGVRYLTGRRARALERKFTRLALAAGKLAQQPAHRPGNANRPDLCQSARQQYELGRLVARRDRLESRHFAWQLRYEKLDARVQSLRRWKGRKMPYLFGILDTGLILWMLQQVGLVRIDLSQILQMLDTLLTR